jgi:hypothetical protein
MQVDEKCRDGLLVLKIAERTLVRPPDWDGLPALARQDVVLVALDFAQVEFVSSLFWQACVGLNARLTDKGQGLALMHLSAQQKQVFELVDGSSRLAVVEDREQLEDRLRMLQPRNDPDGAVSGAEKRMLWR